MLKKTYISTKLLSIEPILSECFFVELNLHNRKWLISCYYILHKINIFKHIEILSKNLDLYSSQYENNIIIGDFNVGVSDPHMTDFCNAYNLSSLIKEPTCYKNTKTWIILHAIDLILTNSPHSFQGSCVVGTGLSDVHKGTFKKYGRSWFLCLDPPPPFLCLPLFVSESPAKVHLFGLELTHSPTISMLAKFRDKK